jgi:hypothetical protein
LEQRALIEMVRKHDEDLYRGDPPGTGLTTRMALIEREVGKLAHNSNKLLWAALLTLLGVIAEIFKSVIIKFL